MTTFKLGCDPELFVKKGRKAVSAHGLIPGTKKEPHPVNLGAVQVDGMALEFNTNPVDLTYGNSMSAVFDKTVMTVINEMKKLLKENGEGYSFKITPIQDFDAAYIEAQPEEAKELGCDPDFNAYTKEPNPRPDGTMSFRTGSGHLHYGWTEGIPATHPDHIEICANFIKILDVTVGFYMCIIDPDNRRRELYGKAGAFRPKSYGVEYRTPSNAWLTSSLHRRMVYTLSNSAVFFMKSGKDLEVVGLTNEKVQKIINEGDYEKAFQSLKEINKSLYYLGWSTMESIEKVYKKRRAFEEKALKVANNV